jgi:hypothetical protein
VRVARGLRRDERDEVALGDVRVEQVQAPRRIRRRVSGGVPFADDTSRTFAPPTREQRPVNSPWPSTYVVDACGTAKPRIEMPAAIRVPGA